MAQDTSISAPVPEQIDAQLALRRLATIAWLAIGLGLAMQSLVLAVQFLSGQVPAAAQIVVDFAQGTTWAFFVCAGVGLGTTIARSRVSLGGLIGLISAPVAMGLAKGTQKAVSSAVGAPEQPSLVPLLTLGAVRALEYGALGWLLAALALSGETRVSRFVLAGAGVGLVFGGGMTARLVLSASAAGTSLPLPRLLSTAINEMLFPIGCALVVFVALRIGAHVRQLTAKG